MDSLFIALFFIVKKKLRYVSQSTFLFDLLTPVSEILNYTLFYINVLYLLILEKYIEQVSVF